MEAIQIISTQLKYDYDQLDLGTAITTRGAAIEIKAHAEQARISMIVIGQKLTEVKALLPHGQFEDWCKVEFEMSQRTAQRMMAAAEVFGDKSDTVSLLSDSAMYMLSAPSVPEAARVEVIFGYRRDDGKRISGVQKGEHKFSWLNDDWPDIYEKGILEKIIKNLQDNLT